MFKEVWEYHGVPKEGRWPLKNDDKQALPFLLIQRHILPDMLDKTALQGKTWGHKEVSESLLHSFYGLPGVHSSIFTLP